MSGRQWHHRIHAETRLQQPLRRIRAFRARLYFIAGNCQTKKIATRMTTARFPSRFFVASFDSKLSTISTRKLNELTELTWLERCENL